MKKRLNIHAGHNPAHMIGCGAVGILNESIEDRAIKNEVLRLLGLLGHTAYDCTVDNGKNADDVLTKIVEQCNAHYDYHKKLNEKIDYDVSIHLNAGRKDLNGDGQTGGVEVLIYSEDMRPVAEAVCKEIAALGFRNRGVKVNKSLYVLRKTKAPAMLIECCFVDDADDARLYNAASMAKAIVKGLTGEEYVEPSVTPDAEASKADAETAQGDPKKLYRVQVGAYSVKDNAERMKAKLIAAGFDAYIVG